MGAIVLMFPGAIAAMAAGALFGMLRGCLLVYLGTCLGQTLAFVLGRCEASPGENTCPPPLEGHMPISSGRTHAHHLCRPTKHVILNNHTKPCPAASHAAFLGGCKSLRTALCLRAEHACHIFGLPLLQKLETWV